MEGGQMNFPGSEFMVWFPLAIGIIAFTIYFIIRND